MREISSEPESHAGDAFCALMRSLHRLEGPAWFALDLSMAQFKVLMLIASTGGLTGRDLAQRLGIGPSAVTPLVDKLVQHGYVCREEDQTDRRVTWARPTPAGLAIFERVSSAGREKFEALLGDLSPEEAALVERSLAILRRAAERRLSQGASTR